MDLQHIQDDVVEDGPHTVSGGGPMGPMGKDDPPEDGVGRLEVSSGKTMDLLHIQDDVVEDGPHTVSGGRRMGPMGKDDPPED